MVGHSAGEGSLNARQIRRGGSYRRKDSSYIVPHPTTTRAGFRCLVSAKGKCRISIDMETSSGFPGSKGSLGGRRLVESFRSHSQH